jgi:hypothetical protein
VVSVPLSAQTVVVRRADIERAGWNRVTEILGGAVGWARASVDGSTFSASPDRLPAVGESGPSMPQWIVIVNGQRVPTDLFGWQMLELLPISVGQIDSVVFTRGPTIYAGVPITRGVMSIFSRRARPGVNGELTYQHGDESGDPGPYRYTDLSSPNVEKIGPFAHGDVGWRGESWDVDAGLHLASLNITDTLIASRFPGAVFSQLRQDVLSITPTLRAGVDGFGGRQEVLASRGEQRGLLFMPTQRAEQSLRTTESYVGVGGSLVAIESTTVAYEASTSVLDANDLDSPLPFTVGNSRRHVGGMLSASRAVGRSTLTVGAIGERWTLEMDAIPGSRSSSGGGPLVRALVPIGTSTTIDGNATMIFDGSRRASLDASVAASFRLDSATSLVIRGSRVQAHPNMDGNWIDAFVLRYELPSRVPAFSALGVSVDRRFLPYVGATVEVRAEHVADWAGLGRPSVAQLASTPVDDLRAQVSASPIRDFRLSTIAAFTGGSRWLVFGSSPGASASVPPIRRIDASMEKWMWQRRLRLELVYRNLLNEPERYHPFGAQWNLRWHVSGSLIL